MVVAKLGLRIWATVAALSLVAACGESPSGGAPGASSGASNAGAESASAGNAGSASSSAGAANPDGGAASGAAGSGAGGAAGAGGVQNPGFDAQLTLTALAANRSVGLEWNVVEGASTYRIYWAAGAAPTTASEMSEVAAPRAAFVHRALTNGTAYHYAVAAVVGGQQSALSAEALATPDGEWVLEELGSGLFDDVATGGLVPRVPVAERVHVLLFAEGYTSADLPIFHDDADHAAERGSDVDRWVDYVFGLQPYADFREAFVVWYLPRASATHFDGADTAFMVPVVDSATGNIANNGETATRAWAALGLLPIQPTDFSAEGFGSARRHVASFLLFDAGRGRAGVSGRMLALRNPASADQRIASAFGVGHAHEFTHAFSSLRDEYIELDNSAPNNAGETANVVGDNQCGALPWQHLLSGGSINPSTAELVGAFGTPEQGYHPELICLLNGTHDNAAHYGGDGLLRDDDRMCNFCREITAYRIYSRSGVLGDDAAGFTSWKASYRAKFFERFPFQAPAVVPQTNDVQNPAQGTPVYEACSATAQRSQSQRATSAPAAARHGCVSED